MITTRTGPRASPEAIAIHEAHHSWGECTACGHWFTSDTTFDMHVGPIPEKGRPGCLAPQGLKHGRRRLILRTCDHGTHQAWTLEASGDPNRPLTPPIERTGSSPTRPAVDL